MDRLILPTEVFDVVSQHLDKTSQKRLSTTSTSQLADYIERQTRLYVEYITQNQGHYATAVRKITDSLREDEAILNPFSTLILLPFTKNVNGQTLSEEKEICQYLLWLVRYKVHPVHVAYGLYQSGNNDQFLRVCDVFNNPMFEEQFKLAVAFMNENAQDVLEQCEKLFPKTYNAVLFLKNCTKHKQLYENRMVHHLDLAYTNNCDVGALQMCICYGKNMVWFEDFEFRYLSRVNVDDNDAIIKSASHAFLTKMDPSFYVQRADTSLAQIKQVPLEEANTSDGIVQYEPFLNWTNGFRIVKCARYSEIVIVLTENGDIYAHACGQTHPVLHEHGPFVDLVFHCTLSSDDVDEATEDYNTCLYMFALSATGIVYDINCEVRNERVSLACTEREYHFDTKLVTQLALLKDDNRFDRKPFCIITMHHEGSLYANFINGRQEKIASNVTLIPNRIYNTWSSLAPYIFVVCNGTLKRIFLRFFQGAPAEDEEVDADFDYYDIYSIITTKDSDFNMICTIQDIELNPRIDTASIIQMVQDNVGTLYCLTSTGTVYQCKWHRRYDATDPIFDLHENPTMTFDCSSIELSKDNTNTTIRTFTTPDSESVDAVTGSGSDSDDDMSLFLLGLRLRF